MADQKQDESFKIIDRRPFTAEGELREEALEQERRDREVARAPAGKTATPKKTDSSSAPPSGEMPQRSATFEGLINSLAGNGALMLGAYPDPRTGQAFVDLEGAREVIDILDALREKTQGNLAPEEDQLLIDVLGKLKLSFLEVSKQATKAVKEKAKSRP